jgi:hypothetical protein
MNEYRECFEIYRFGVYRYNKPELRDDPVTLSLS